MASLTVKQGVKVKAVLSMIHANGHDAEGVSQLAGSYMTTGFDERQAYEQAINDFMGQQPDMAGMIGKAVRLVEASDHATVAQYDAALSSYIDTGDEAGINALAPMIAADSMALAIQHGELGADARADGLADALGFEPGPSFTADAQPASTQAPQASAIGLNSAPAAHNIDMQVSLGSGTGQMAPGAAARWNSTPYTGAHSAAPALNGLTPDAVRAAARASAAGGGWSAPIEVAVGG